MKYLQTGRSMLEMLAVLALMGLISFAGLVGYNEAIVRNQAVNIGKDALLRAAAVNALSQSYFVRSLSENAAIDLSGFSDEIQDMTVSTKKETNASFIITYTGVPKRVCERVIETNAIGLYKTTVNNADLSLDNMTTICTGATNTISFSFYRAGYTSSRVEEAGDSGSSSTTNPCAEIRCNGCQVCLNGVCVNDSSKCSGCQTCNGICIDDDSKCGSGSCINGTCYCPAGVSGDDCSEVTLNCNNGYYDSTTGKCVCNTGYTGTYCDTAVDLCAGITCSGHGTCANGVCTCNTDYYGDDCSVQCTENQVYADGECTCTTISNCNIYNSDCTCRTCDSSYIPADNKKSCLLTPNCAVYPEGSSCYVSPSIIGVCHNGGCLEPSGSQTTQSPVSDCSTYSDGTLCYYSSLIISICQSGTCSSIDEVTDPSTGESTHNPGSESGSTN